MKKAILALALVMSMGATQVSWASSAPKHRYQPSTQQVDNQNALEAYSDTTSTDTASYDDFDNDDNRAYHSKYSLGNYDDPFDFIGSVFVSGEFEKKKIAIKPSTLNIKIHFFCLLVIYASFF